MSPAPWGAVVHEVFDEVEDVLSVEAEDAPGASTVCVETERCNSCDDIAVTEEVGTPPSRQSKYHPSKCCSIATARSRP